jgi:hypothetical protein
MDPFYRQQRALNQEWKRQQQASMAFLHNYRSAGTGLTGVGNNTNENEAIVIPAHGDGHQAGIIEYDIDAAIRFHELQESLDERMTLAVNTPLPPDIDEAILTLTENVNKDVNDCELVIQVTGTYDPEKEGAERDENTDDEQSRPMDPVSKEMADENNDDSGECLEEELYKENPTVFHMNLKDEPANETIDDDIDDIDEVLDDLLGDTYEQDGKRLIFESKVDADKDLEPPELRRIANEPEDGDENKNKSSEMNGFDKLVEYMSANISSETAPDNLEELLELQNEDAVVLPPRSDAAEVDDTRDEAKVETAARPFGPITSSPTIEYETTEIPKGTLPDRQMSQIATPPPSSRSRAKKKVESKIVRPQRCVANQNGGIRVPHYMTPTVSTPERRVKVETFSESHNLRRSPLFSQPETTESSKVKSNTCKNMWIPDLHPSRGGCERCLHFASEEERLKFNRNGHHYRVCNVRGGCSRECPCFPRNSDQAPVRLCRKCFYDTHRFGEM